MSDLEPVPYNRIQFSFFANGGDQTVLRAESGEELVALTEDLAKNSEAFLKALNSAKQAQVASGVFTGDNPKKATSTGSGNGKRAADTPPPAASDEDAPECLHGPMMRGKPEWKRTWYCTQRGKSKECWARD